MIGFGCSLPQHNPSFDTIRSVAQECESLGFDSVWMYDHFYPYAGPAEGPCYESWTTLSALSTITSKIRFGTLVLCNEFRYPAIVAKMSSILDNISKGRLELGIGAGWFKAEFDGYGIPFRQTQERIERLREGIQIIKQMWLEEKATFKGKQFHVLEAYNNPKPVQKPHPPVWIGGTDPGVMRVAAELADGWNIGFYPSNTLEGFKRKNASLDRYCKSVNRNPNEVRRSWHGEVLIARSPTEVKKKVERFKPVNQSPEEYSVARIIGTPEEVVTKIRQYGELGATYFMANFPDITELEPIRLFAREVMPRFR